MAAILVVDDEKAIQSSVAGLLSRQNYAVTSVGNGEAALDELSENSFDLALIDYKMPPPMDGLELLEKMTAIPAAPPAILMTGYGSIETAVEAMRKGAIDFVSKPFTAHELIHVVNRNLQSRLLEKEVKELRRRIDARDKALDFGIVVESAEMRRVLQLASQIATSAAPILIEGETGTGKELLARYIHQQSPRANRPFVAVNCGALHPELLLSELFGHKRGAFTGAVEDRVGRFELADGGTIFLDEIGELEPSAQTKLLRVLQEKSFERVGDPRTIHVDVRVLAATNRRLEDMVAEETFRGDLYYRLAVITVRIPPLRERIDDILPMAEKFLRHYGGQIGRNDVRWSEEAKQALLNAKWMGNVRELQNSVQRAVLLTPTTNVVVDCEFLQSGQKGGSELVSTAATHLWTLDELEREYLRALLSRRELRMNEICRILQIDATTLWRKRKKFGL